MLGSLLGTADACEHVGAAFERALSKITAEERVFIKMRLIHGCTVAEIARAFHFDVRTFRRRFCHLLLVLQRHVAAGTHERR